MFLDTEPPHSISSSKSESETPIRSEESTKQRMKRLEGKNYGPNSTNMESDIIHYSEFEEDGSIRGRFGNIKTEKKGQVISITSPQTNPINNKLLGTK